MLLSSHPNDPISSCPVCSYGPKLTKLTALLSVNVQIVSSPTTLELTRKEKRRLSETKRLSKDVL